MRLSRWSIRAAALFAAAFGAATMAAQSPTPPNIVIILADDLGLGQRAPCDTQGCVQGAFHHERRLWRG